MTFVKPGGYRIARANGRLTATMPCPKCGKLFSIINHLIAEGSVAPSVVCPHVECPSKACGFHDTMYLEGWPGHDS